ncbi:MAG TPA: hypothetical protein VEK15_00685, partial [Vicinamibacteria bacterium]|nr:hypothetical protein [Vicinamibacteria bacterium]
MNARSFLLATMMPAALLALGHSCAVRTVDELADVTDVQFSGLIREISEDGGYFWSNNYISNETSYQHVLGQLESIPLAGGVYIGVGPNQNFTYIAATRPELAFIVDIRRQNMLEHLLFKVLIEDSETRAEYLSRLLGRPLPVPPARTATIEEIVAGVRAVAPDEGFFTRQLAFVIDELRGFPELALT